MIPTERDVRLVRDAALSHCLSRDQIIRLGYFSSVCRANARLLELVRSSRLAVLETPFHKQFIYRAGPAASDLVGERVAAVIRSRPPSPRFLRHCLAVTEIRIAMRSKGFEWRFEAQVWDRLGSGSELRPDGAAVGGGRVIFVEADMGSADLGKFGRKLDGYGTYVSGGRFAAVYGSAVPEVLVVTTGAVRKRSFERLAARVAGVRVRAVTFDDMGLRVPGCWS